MSGNRGGKEGKQKEDEDMKGKRREDDRRRQVRKGCTGGKEGRR